MASAFRLSQRGYRGPLSDHFDGARFLNQNPVEHATPLSFLKWVTNRDRGPWSAWTPSSPGPPPPERVLGGEVRATFINHATVLLQIDGLNLLTDPIWSERTSPVSWAGPKRVRPPGLRFEDLPPIDAVLLSHNHYDHMDLPTLVALEEAHHPTILCGLGTAELLAEHGMARAVELDWWQRTSLGDLEISFVPAQHFSGRGLSDRDKVLWGGFVVHATRGPLYFAGDTALGPHFAQIRERFGPMRLSLLPIGAFRPVWFMRGVHVSPAEAVAAHQILESRQSIGIHFGTFPLADDGQHEPVTELARALAEAKVPSETFVALEFGATLTG